MVTQPILLCTEENGGWRLGEKLHRGKKTDRFQLTYLLRLKFHENDSKGRQFAVYLCSYSVSFFLQTSFFSLFLLQSLSFDLS